MRSSLARVKRLATSVSSAGAASAAWTAAAWSDSDLGEDCFLAFSFFASAGLALASAAIACCVRPSGFWNSGRSQRTFPPPLLVGPLVIQGHQPFEDLLFAQVHRPPVGVGHRRVQFVVDLPKHRNQPLLVDRLLLFRERLAGAQLLKHVVHPRHRQLRMQLLLPLAIRAAARRGCGCGILGIRWRRGRERVRSKGRFDSVDDLQEVHRSRGTTPRVCDTTRHP